VIPPLFTNDSFEKGSTYVLHTRWGQQRFDREHVLTYMGDGYWNARPFAGTQQILASTIKYARKLSSVPSMQVDGGRGDKRHVMNRMIRPTEQ
jgi:hypothetical protein